MQFNNKRSIMRFCKIPVIAILFLVSLTMNGQIIKTKLDIVGGVSYPEFFHAGLRYQYTSMTQFGIYVGENVNKSEANIFTCSIDNMIHFGKHSYHSNRPVWFARQGFNYDIVSEVDKKRKYSYVNISFGRDFPINDWLGINLDAGLLMQVREKTEYKMPGLETDTETGIKFLPSVRLQVFFSL
jgi:hypothetical protein